MKIKAFKYKDTYKKLIQYYYNKCDLLILINDSREYNKKIRIKNHQKMTKIENKLKKSLYKKINLSSPKENKNREIFTSQYYYILTPEVLKYLLSNKNLKDLKCSKYPTNLYFMKNGYALLIIMDNMERYDIDIKSKEEYEYLKSIGIEFYEKRFTKASSGYLYYEDMAEFDLMFMIK